MRKPYQLKLSEAQHRQLEQCMRTYSTAPVVRLRCQIILLKAQGRSATDIGSIVGACSNSVHSWVKRYQSEGIRGLLTKAGRGRKKLLKEKEDAPAVVLSIKEHRQSLKATQAAFEAQGGKHVSEETFRTFLKSLATPIKESEKGWVKRRTKHSTTIK